MRNSSALPSTTALTVAAGATVDLRGHSETVASLSGAGTVTDGRTVAASLTVAPASGTTSTFSGVIQNGSGTVSLTINGSGMGTEILAGQNTFTGTTTISGGTLQLGDGIVANGSVAGDIVNSALVFANPSAQTYGGTISGTGTLTLAGSGAIELAGAVELSPNSIVYENTGNVTFDGNISLTSDWTIGPTTRRSTSPARSRPTATIYI